MAKKTRIEDIDSEAVINSFRLDDTSIPPEARSTGGNAPSPPPKEELQTVITSPASRPKEEPERKRRNGKPEKQDYDTVFMCGSNITARLGKQVYIRKEYHDRIQKMLHVIGGNEVTIAAFLDNVLTHHFTLFQDEIAESFKRHMESYNLPALTSARIKAETNRSRLSCKHRKSKRGNVYTSAEKFMRKSLSSPVGWKTA